ncbi:MAG: hypothetical protein BJ554DRAFT_735, partial [Olpidium bornovanus]
LSPPLDHLFPPPRFLPPPPAILYNFAPRLTHVWAAAGSCIGVDTSRRNEASWAWRILCWLPWQKLCVLPKRKIRRPARCRPQTLGWKTPADKTR